MPSQSQNRITSSGKRIVLSMNLQSTNFVKIKVHLKNSHKNLKKYRKHKNKHKYS